MARITRRRLQESRRHLVTASVVVALLLVEAVLGLLASPFEAGRMVAVALSLAALVAALWRLELAIALLAGLSMYPSPTILDVQGRVIGVIHLAGGLVLAAWLLRRLVVQRDVSLPKTRLNAPLFALILIWPLAWLAGYAFWDSTVPTFHRQPLFFAAEYGQLLLFVAVFWATADTVRSERWIQAICIIMILGNASTVVLGEQLHWNQTPVALALACAFLAFGRAGLPQRAGLGLLVGVFLWGLLGVNRIPIYLANATVILVVLFFRSRPLFVLALIVFAVWSAVFLRPIWLAEGSIGGRLELAQGALSIFKARPFLGVGPTHYRSYAIIHHRVLGWGWHTVESGMLLPHDIWLYFLANVGVAGSLAILWLVGSMFWQPFTVFRRAEVALSRVLAVAAMAAVAGVVVQSAGGHLGFLPDYNLASFYMAPVWILMGLVVARSRVTAGGQGDG